MLTETAELRLFVPGIPKPQGSLRHIPMGGRIRTVHANHDDLLAWRSRITDHAADLWGDTPPLDGAVHVGAMFWLPRPKSTPKWDRWPRRKPDLDKLLRAVLDALTGIVLTDDARVVDVAMGKRFAVEHQPGMDLAVTPMDSPT